MDVPEGQMKISPAFQRWDVYQTRPSPEGRLINGANRFAFNRPFGTQILRTSFPALKRQATLAMSSGTIVRDQNGQEQKTIPIRTALDAEPAPGQRLDQPRAVVAPETLIHFVMFAPEHLKSRDENDEDPVRLQQAPPLSKQKTV